MSAVDRWIKELEDTIGQIAGDESLSDEEYIEVLENLVDLAQASIDAKKSELEAE